MNINTPIIKNYSVPPFILEAMLLLKPPDSLTVSQWADKYRILDSKTSSIPGTWRTVHTPYLKEIMDCFNDPEVEEITFVKSTQIGGTECLNNMLGYIIAQDPDPTLIVYPTLDLAEFTSDNRLQPMIQLCDVLSSKFNPDSKRLELQFPDMYISLSGANSPASLASKAIRYLFFDEIDKYPPCSGKEADPRSLARERTKTFASNRKIFQTSTPTLETGAIWQAWEKADCQKEFFVGCPHCGEFQTLKFSQIEWQDEKNNAELARNTAVYVCEFCGAILNDSDVNSAVKNGVWRDIKNNGKKSVAYHINAIYSPWVRIGDVAYEFKRSHHDMEQYMNFYNSWLAEPWRQIESGIHSDKIKEKVTLYQSNEIPDNTALITAGVDVQRNCFYYTIRAWLPDMTNYNIAHGKVNSWQDIEFIMNAEYFDRLNHPHLVNLCLVDSGDQTDSVYEFCAFNREWAKPCKGASRKILSRYTMSKIEKQGNRADGMSLIIIDTNYYKDTIEARINREGNGGFYIYRDCDDEYINQVASEHKVTEKKGSQIISTWKKRKTTGNNHYLDCEVYSFCAADICGIRGIQEDLHNENVATNTSEKQLSPEKSQLSSNWLRTNNNWLNTGGDWF